jgi:GntR family transcriptional regulator, transcriptional repressor for pyruvate dehydrogenase complex
MPRGIKRGAQISTPEQVAARLREMIISGRYAPGDRLPAERSLLSTLDVSRPALREGIHRLSSEGVLDVRLGSGTYVGEVDLPSLFAVRQQLEPLAARLAAEVASPEEKRRLEGQLEPLRNVLEDADRFAELDIAMHAKIAEMSANSILISVLANLAFMSRMSRRVTAPSDLVREDALDDMEKIVRAILDGQAKQAEKAMASHLRHVEVDASVTDGAPPPSIPPRPASRA